MGSMAGMMIAAGIVGLVAISPARAEVQDCIPVNALPAVITQPGVYCFKQDLATATASGNAITINANSVTLDLNGFKLGGLAAGTSANGIYAQNRQNITIRNGTVRGFAQSVYIDATSGTASNGHIVEDMRIDGSRGIGITVRGSHTVVRNNTVFKTVSSSPWGILVQFGSGHSVLRNIVSGVVGEGAAYGIGVDAAEVLIEGNEIKGLSADQTFGIWSASGGRHVIKGNVVVNSTVGTIGIVGNASSSSCIDNFVSNFSSAYTVCALSDGNRSLDPS